MQLWLCSNRLTEEDVGRLVKVLADEWPAGAPRRLLLDVSSNPIGSNGLRLLLGPNCAGPGRALEGLSLRNCRVGETLGQLLLDHFSAGWGLSAIDVRENDYRR